MKLIDLKKFINGNEILEDVELYCNNNPIIDISMVDNKLVFHTENALDQYYTYKENVFNLREYISEFLKEEIIDISEIEAIAISKKFNLNFEDVVGELEKHNINVNII